MNTIHFLRRNAGYFVVLLLAIFFSCAPNAYIEGPPYKIDIQPPVIQSAEVLDNQTIEMRFDEQISSAIENIEIEPELGIASVESDEKRLIVRFSSSQGIGVSYTMRTEVEDLKGNSLSFLYQFSGWNPHVPELLINEINPRGSKSTPDCVELFVLTDGNLGGLMFVIGTEGNAIDTLAFPAIEISKGDYIVIHTKPEGLPEEVDELEEVNTSGGRLALETARDFWMRDAPGLPSNNGAVTLYKRKGGAIIDAVIWSDRDDVPGEDDLGWTSTSFPWVQEIGLQGEWLADGDIPLPSETLPVGSSTATRSLCRGSIPHDSNAPDDWHTVPTRGQTFGMINIDEVHEP